MKPDTPNGRPAALPATADILQGLALLCHLHERADLTPDARVSRCRLARVWLRECLAAIPGACPSCGVLGADSGAPVCPECQQRKPARGHSRDCRCSACRLSRHA